MHYAKLVAKIENTTMKHYEVIKATRLEDLALLCSNCHRMVHRDMGVRSVEEFKRKRGK